MARGSAVIHDNKVYFAGYLNEMVFYDTTTNHWNELPDCPYKGSSLAVVGGLVTTIGGYNQHTIPTNMLLRLIKIRSSSTWEEHFSPMPTKRYGTMAITTIQHLIVAGGESGISHHVNTVEVMDIQTLVWWTVASLPHPYTGASGTICGDRIFMLGGMDEKGYTTSVLTCVVGELLQSSWLSPVWHRIADVSFYRSTCATVNGELLVVGGVTQSQTKTPTIHKYNPATNSWDLISKMPTARYLCQVAVLADNNEIMVVGGHTGMFNTTTDKVEIASVTLKD